MRHVVIVIYSNLFAVLYITRNVDEWYWLLLRGVPCICKHFLIYPAPHLKFYQFSRHSSVLSALQQRHLVANRGETEQETAD
jgi:hypothetical protein